MGAISEGRRISCRLVYDLDESETIETLAGAIQSRTALRLIMEWSLARRSELEANWERAKAGEPLERIAPLD